MYYCLFYYIPAHGRLLAANFVHATRTLLPWEISCIIRFLNGISFSIYLLSHRRWPLNQTLEKFGVIAILKFLLENLLNPDI